ncbi:MAG: tRNA-dihydrouridine synthase family protein [Candidatus Hodarchaeales archaeon]
MVEVPLLGLKNPMILSPLADITIPPFRRICAEFGAITVSEMTFAKGLLNSDPKSVRRITRSSSEFLYGIQLLTNSLTDLKKTISLIQSKEICDFIELNVGCPKQKITDLNLGAGLLKYKNLPLLKKLVEEATSVAEIPFSLKIRAGFEKESFLQVFNIAEKANVSFITFHARLAKDTYQTSVRKEYWDQITSDYAIPVIVNGDIHSYSDAQTLIKDYHIDGTAIGRAARGNPQIFASHPKLPKWKVYELLISYMKGTTYFNLFNLRLQSSDFLKNFRYSATARKQLLKMKEPKKIIEYTREFLREN